MNATDSAHRRALVLMMVVPAMWSIAGVITRHLDQPQGAQITFWRSVFAALAVLVYLVVVRRDFWPSLRAGGWPGLVSGLMWSVMFTCFMLALTRTTVANTLIVMSIAPVVTALLTWLVLHETIRARTWVAITAATAGLGWMFGDGFSAGHATGMLIALAVPLASASNFVLTKKFGHAVDLIPAVFIGGVVSSLVMLPFVWPQMASPGISVHDLAWLAVLGVFQLGVPCMLMVKAARHLSAPELALLALIEVLLGPVWVWLWAGETPATSTIYGGALVLAALVFNEVGALRRTPAVPS